MRMLVMCKNNYQKLLICTFFFFSLEKLLTCNLTALAGNNNIDTVEIINMKLKIKDCIYI